VEVPIDESMLSDSQLGHCMGAAMLAIGVYLPAFRRIISDDVSVECAIAEIER
jgi:hypothetical protein